MPEERNNTEQTRLQRVEDFLLDPERVLFESIEDFKAGIDDLRTMLSNVNLAELEALQGADGKNPERGVEYFNDEDLAAIEEFILDRVPRLGFEVPSVEQVNTYVSESVAKIPRIAGPRGPKGDDGEDGKDGSPDTAEDIIAKLRTLPRNTRLKITDIRGLQNQLTAFREVAETVDNLVDRFDNFKVAVGGNPGGGSGGAVDSVNGQTGVVVLDIDDVAPSQTGHAGEVLMSDGTNASWQPAGGTGTVTSVGMSVPTGFAVSGSPVTTTGTFALTYDTGYQGYTSAEASKLSGIEANADVTDATNVGAAGAFMKAVDDTDDITVGATNKFATAAEKTKLGYISVTQAVNLDQMETDIAALANGMVYKGNWDASAGTFPGAGAAQIGWFYYVSVAGTVDGVSFAIGDNIVATVANASTTTYAANWSKHDQTDAVQDVAGLVGSISASSLRSALNVEDGADVTDSVNVGSVNAAATSKTTPIDADSFPIVDSAASNVIKRVTFTNLKAFLKTYFDTLYQAVGSHITASSTDTLTNKRMQPRTASSTTSSNLSPSLSTANVYYRTTQTATLTIDAPTGTPVIGEVIMIYVDSAGAQTLTINGTYKPFGAAFPATTTAGKTFMMSCQYNGTDWKTLWANAI